MVDDVPGAVKPTFNRKSGEIVNADEILKTSIYYDIYNDQIYEVNTDIYILIILSLPVYIYCIIRRVFFFSYKIQ